MSDEREGGDAGSGGASDAGGERATQLLAGRCECGHVTYPPHAMCPECGDEQTGTVDLSDREAEVLTWTEVATTPPGVREPNTLAIVAFEVAGQRVRALGGITGEVSIGDTVRPVYVEQLRDPEACVRETDSQRWDGFRFKPV
jgi:uncharacterized OB-fold protein